MKKSATQRLILSVALVVIFAGTSYSAPTPKSKTTNPLLKFLNEIEYTSRFKFEFDDNIFLSEDGQDSDYKEIFNQTLTYQKSIGNQYFRMAYSGNYAYYDTESLGILGHTASALYSYRPFKKFSFGIRNDFNWLQNSKVTTVIGDRVLALGYSQYTPSLQLKYEINPIFDVVFDGFYQSLDVRNQDNDEYIDNRQGGGRVQFNWNYAEKEFIGFAGYNQRQTEFTQIHEKSQGSHRGFFGFQKDFPSFFSFREEVGFETIDMEEGSNSDDNNVDSITSIETTFSVYTKGKISYTHSAKYPSLRSDYTQYGANTAALNIVHTINPKTSLLFDYDYTRQHFSETDALVGQPKIDRDTHINHLACTLSRKLQPWLTLDLKYDYTKRDTDFANEGYTDNKVSTALTAKY